MNDMPPSPDPIMSRPEDDDAKAKTVRIRELNNLLRTTGIGGRIMVTQAVLQLGEHFLADAVAAMRSFSAFSADNDPHQEHDFGSFVADGQPLYFKIDYYAPSMDAGSDDPSDPSRCTRVLTLMLQSDY